MIKDRIANVDFTPIVAEVVKWRTNSDIASIGGAVFESKLAEALCDDDYVVFTQKEVSSLVDEGVSFDFPVSWDTIKNESHVLGSPFYAVDLFEFERDGLVMTDAVSLKTSVTDSNSNVFVVNDNEGVVVPNYINGDDTYLGKVLTAIIRPTEGTFSVFYFDGYFSEVVDSLEMNTDKKDNLVFRSTEKATNLVKATNRHSDKKANAKTTSFDRGVTVKPAYLASFAQLVTSGQFDSVEIKTMIVSDLLSR